MRTVILTILALVFPLSAMAAEPLTFVMESYEPYEYTEAGAFKGFDVEAIRKLCARLDCEPHFVDVPWARATQMVQEGDAHAIFSLFKTPEREAFLVYPEERLSQERNVLVTQKGAAPITSMADLAGKTVGIVSGYTYGDPFDASTEFTKEEATNNDMLLKKLAAGRSDAVVINQLVLETVAGPLGLAEAFEIQPLVISEGDMFVAFSKAKGETAQKWAEAFARELKALRAEGSIK
ncbi:substrate-binding periplasmic protein [Megalodesulfovibrio paquesii]